MPHLHRELKQVWHFLTCTDLELFAMSLEKYNSVVDSGAEPTDNSDNNFPYDSSNHQDNFVEMELKKKTINTGHF